MTGLQNAQEHAEKLRAERMADMPDNVIDFESVRPKKG